MTLEEFYAEPVKAEPVKIETVRNETALPGPVKDEILPPHVFKCYIRGEIVYMTCTEDGRMVRIEDFGDSWD